MSKNDGVETAASCATPDPAMCCTSIEPVQVPVRSAVKFRTGLNDAGK